MCNNTEEIQLCHCFRFIVASKFHDENSLGHWPYLRREVVLLELPALSQVPGADCVIKATCPELCAIMRDVNTAGTICVALELPAIHEK